jgi:hypothetical protein
MGVGLVALVLGAGTLFVATQGQAQSLPTLDQLRCTGQSRSSGDVLYEEGVRTYDTPEKILARYSSSPEGRAKGVVSSAAAAVSYNHTRKASATRAQTTLNTRGGSPGSIITFYRAGNGDWRIDSIVECG